MKPTKLNFNTIVMILSLAILVAVLGYFYFSNHPPTAINLLRPTRPGSLIIEADEPVLVNQPFKVRLIADPNHQTINAVGFYLRFNPTNLQLLNLDTTQSFCQFYPEKKFDNVSGTVTLVCGAPHPGTSEKSIIMELEFMPLTVGTHNLLIDPKSQILLSDGKGTNILDGQDIHYQISVLNNL